MVGRGSSKGCPVSILRVGSGCGPSFCVPRLGGRDKRVEGSSPSAACAGAGEDPVATSDRDSTQLALGGVVRHEQAAVVEEAGELSPPLEAVVDSLAGVAACRDPNAVLA